jgi:hypothetical protein
VSSYNLSPRYLSISFNVSSVVKSIPVRIEQLHIAESISIIDHSLALAAIAVTNLVDGTYSLMM